MDFCGLARKSDMALVYIPPSERGFLRTGGAYGRFDGGAKGELKFMDSSVASEPIPDVDSEVDYMGPVDLVDIAQGTAYNERRGRNVVIKSIEGRGRLLYTPTVAAEGHSEVVYLFLVQDTQNRNALNPPFGDTIFTNTDVDHLFVKPEEEERFKILKSWVVHMSPEAGHELNAYYNAVVKQWEWKLDCNIPITYTGTAGTVDERVDNSIWLYGGRRERFAEIVLTAEFRVRYSDQ